MLKTGRLEKITSSHILLLNGEVDLTSSLVIHTDDGDYNVGDELNKFRGDNIKLYIIKEDTNIINDNNN